jgi:hypothetical protein
MYLVERVDRYLHAQKSPSMLIGDRENETIAGKFAEKLSHYRTDGTKFEYQTNVRSLIRRIRRKFSAVDTGFSEIKNVPDVGYAWRDPQSSP